MRDGETAFTVALRTLAYDTGVNFENRLNYVMEINFAKGDKHCIYSSTVDEIEITHTGRTLVWVDVSGITDWISFSNKAVVLETLRYMILQTSEFIRRNN